MKKSLALDALPRVRYERAVLVLIVLLGFALRVYRLQAQALWWDESLSVYRATRDLGTILSNIILIQNVVTIDTVPPLYFLVLHFLVSAWGASEFGLRYLSLAANVATIPLLYVLARRWFGNGTGLVTAFLGALAPFYVYYAQEARPYALVLFASTLAVYALARAFGGTSPPRARWILTYVLAAAAAIYTHYYAIFLLPFHALLILIISWRQTRQRLWGGLPALPLFASLALVPIIRSSMAGNAGNGPDFVAPGMMAQDLWNSFSVGVTIDMAQVVWVDAMMVVLFLAGLVLSRSSFRVRNALVLLAFMIIPVSGVVAISLYRPLYQNSRYLIAISPAFYVGVAAGIVALAQRWRVLAVPALAVFLAGATLSLNNLYFNPQFGKDDHRAWAEFLRERWQPGDLLVLDSPHTEELYHYYAGDLGAMVTLPILSSDGTQSQEANRAAVRDAYARAQRVWFLEMNVPFDDPEYLIEKLLNENGVLLDRTLYSATSTELALSLFIPALPTATTADIPRPLDIAFAGHLHLRGDAAPVVITAGRRNVIKLFWQIDEPVGEDYAVSLRLVDGAGAAVAQWDSVPLGNHAGTQTWKPGTIMIDAHDLPVAGDTAPGQYRLQVVPYHAATGNPLGDVVTLGDIMLAPAVIPGTSGSSRAGPPGARMIQHGP